MSMNAPIADFGEPQPTGHEALAQILETAAARHGVPADVLKALAWQESGWSPDAAGLRGGKGLMQLDPKKHELALTDAVYDAASCAEFAARELAALQKREGSWEGALTAWKGNQGFAHAVMGLTKERPWEA